MRKKPGISGGFKRRTYTEIAVTWGVTCNTVYHWVRRKLPVQDDLGMADALLRNSKTPEAVRIRALSILGKTDQPPKQEDEIEVEKKLAKFGMVEDLEREASRYQAMQAEALQARDLGRAEAALVSRMKVYRTVIAIRKELRRLGEDAGRVIAREEAERLIAALASRTAVSVHWVVETLSERLLNKSRIEDVAAVLDPEATRRLFLEPFIAAGHFAAECGLPGWVIDALRRGCGDNVNDGEKLFSEALAAQQEASKEAA